MSAAIFGYFVGHSLAQMPEPDLTLERVVVSGVLALLCTWPLFVPYFIGGPSDVFPTSPSSAFFVTDATRRGEPT